MSEHWKDSELKHWAQQHLPPPSHPIPIGSIVKLRKVVSYQGEAYEKGAELEVIDCDEQPNHYTCRFIRVGNGHGPQITLYITHDPKVSDARVTGERTNKPPRQTGGPQPLPGFDGTFF